MVLTLAGGPWDGPLQARQRISSLTAVTLCVVVVQTSCKIPREVRAWRRQHVSYSQRAAQRLI